MKPLARMLGLSLATLLIAGPAAYAADDDLGDLTTKKPPVRKQTVEEENNDPGRNGPMIGLSAGYALEMHDIQYCLPGACDPGDPRFNMATDNSAAYGLHVGYRFNKWISEDLEVQRYQEFDSTPNTPGEVNGWAMGLNTKVYVLHGHFQPFVLAGINLLDMETTNSASANAKKTDDGPAMRFGAGIDYYLTNKVVLTGDVGYMLGFGEVDGYDMLVMSLGFLYRP
jgi:hypothetical protein